MNYLLNYEYWDWFAHDKAMQVNNQLRARTLRMFFKNKDNTKNIWLWGCNKLTECLIELYRDKYNILGVFDSSEALWGTEISGIEVYNPGSVIDTLDETRDVIIIALRLHSDEAYEKIIDMHFNNIYSLRVLYAELERRSSFPYELEQLTKQPLVQDMILIESHNDFDGNTGAVYEYMKEAGYKYRFVWICLDIESDSEYLDANDIKLFPYHYKADLKMYLRLRAVAKWELWEGEAIRKVRSDQVNVFLQHYGMGYKLVSHLYSAPDYVDYVLTTNEFVCGYAKVFITYSDSARFIYGELPRNDVFIHKWNELQKITDTSYDKVVMWAPTFRNMRAFERSDSDISYPYGVSLIYEENDMNQLNEWLHERNMLMIIKLHPRQAVDFEVMTYSNIIYLDAIDIKKFHSYKLLTQMDAMITDYSSIIFDYMLLDRPCAWVLEDREHYKIEYVMDNPDEYMPGDKIYTLGDMKKFLDEVSEGRDTYREERRRLCERCNPPLTGRGCEHLVEALGL